MSAPDPFKKATTGESLEIGAPTWNYLMDAAKDYRDRRLGKSGAQNDRSILVPSNLVYIQNNTGGTLPVWNIVKPGGAVINPAVNPFEVARNPVLIGNTPGAITDPILIVVEPAAAGALARAAIDGCVPAYVDVVSTSHGYATATPGATGVLTSGTTGPARILTPLTTTGTQWVIVQLGLPPGGTSGTTLYLGKNDPPMTRQTTTGTSIIQYSPTTTWTTTLTPDGTSMPGGTYCGVIAFPEAPSFNWIFPVAAATETTSGYVTAPGPSSTLTQFFSGCKGFDGVVVFNAGSYPGWIATGHTFPPANPNFYSAFFIGDNGVTPGSTISGSIGAFGVTWNVLDANSDEQVVQINPVGNNAVNLGNMIAVQIPSVTIGSNIAGGIFMVSSDNYNSGHSSAAAYGIVDGSGHAQVGQTSTLTFADPVRGVNRRVLITGGIVTFIDPI